ncbi:UNVERIFIED_CONTAM: hypothetical protein RMT77_007439 [Armadillidium vulgare]
MNAIITNTNSPVKVCPAMANILSLVFPEILERLGSRIIYEPRYSDESFEEILYRLCNWLIT